VSSDKEDYRVSLQRGIELFNQKNYPEAINELNIALSLNREASEAYFYKGLIFYEMQKYGEAENAFTYAEMYDNKNSQKYESYKQRSHEFALKENGFPVKYGGGHSEFPTDKDVHIFARSQNLEIPEMALNIPYEKITQVRTEGQEETHRNYIALAIVIFIGFVSIILLSFFGLILIAIMLLLFLQTTRKDRMIIGYTDELQLKQIMWFEGDISTLQNIIYKILLGTRQKKGSA
jgi:tetratricopeptide (TPR) repeat protein